jgi:hypothetical protein
MNANELADKLMSSLTMEYDCDKYMEQAATMLRQFGLAESIIKQQQIEIAALKDEVAKWKMSYENSIRFEDGYGHN